MGQLKRITGIPIHSLNKHKLCSMVKHALCLSWASVFCLRYTAFSQRIIAIFAKTFREIKGVLYHDATENAAWLYGTTELGAQSQNTRNVISCPPQPLPSCFLENLKVSLWKHFREMLDMWIFQGTGNIISCLLLSIWSQQQACYIVMSWVIFFRRWNIRWIWNLSSKE